MTDLLKKSAMFIRTSAIDSTFKTLKHALVNAPVLALLDYSQQFVVELMRVMLVYEQS